MAYVPGLSEQVSKKILKYAADIELAPRPSNKVSHLYSDMKQKLRIGQCLQHTL